MFRRLQLSVIELLGAVLLKPEKSVSTERDGDVR